MATCQCCGREASQANALTCSACGESSWEEHRAPTKTTKELTPALIDAMLSDGDRPTADGESSTSAAATTQKSQKRTRG